MCGMVGWNFRRCFCTCLECQIVGLYNVFMEGL